MISQQDDGLPRLETGVRNLDALLGGGLPRGTVTVVAGSPGAGKTILVQQLCFHAARGGRRVLYFNTLSEPTAKTLRYMRQFSFFDPALLETAVQFVDVGVLARSQGLGEATRLVMERVKETRPEVVVIDSFKVFDELARSREELRKFGYELAVQLMAWEVTTFLLGEYGPEDIATNPLFSIVDALLVMSQRHESGEQQRFLQLVKLRGARHSRSEHPFMITSDGVEVFAPRLTIQRTGRDAATGDRCLTRVSKLDALLGEGIPWGSSLLLAGAAGAGKTVLLLEFIYRGAQAGERGIVFSFEETEERLRATARGLGWDFDAELERGMIEVVFIPQPGIEVERHLLMIQERVERLQARRVGIDSVSVFLHRVQDAQVSREKLFQLATIVQNVGAVGLFATDIPYGKNQLSRFGVEETVVDGVLLLSLAQEGLDRERYLEVYKLRNTAHLKGRHNITIGPGGVTVYPRYSAEDDPARPPPPLDTSRRLTTGVPGFDELLGGGLLERSVTLLSGSAGIGKSTMSMQFMLAGAALGERGVYVALEEGPAQLRESARALGLDLEGAIERGLVELVYLPRERVRPGQFLSLLTDHLRDRVARRLVVDSVTHLVTQTPPDSLHQLLYALTARFKTLGVTTLLAHEASSLFSIESVTDQRFSAVADNIVIMRYRATKAGLSPTLAVLKTRGSQHDWGVHEFAIEPGCGVRIGGRLRRSPRRRAAAKDEPPRRRRTQRRRGD